MEAKVIVMIVQLAMPNGEAGVQVRPMPDAKACYSAAKIEASDPFVASVACSELVDGKLHLDFKPRDRNLPQTSNFKSTG